MEHKGFIIDALGLGFALWLAGYLSSVLLYFFISKDVLGWVLFMVFAPITVYVAYWRLHKRNLRFNYFLGVAAAWALIAIVFDYLFIVKLFSSSDYYKPDVYLYYAATFLIPAGLGLKYSRSV